jgi:two-component system sensor histidine kinase BaeS
MAPVDELALQDRVTLLDVGGRYVAGRNSEGDASVRRAIEVDGQPVGYLVVAKAARPSDAMSSAFVEQLKKSLLIIVTLSIALSALAAVLLAAHFRKPILRLADGARALAEGKFDTRLPEQRSDELGELAHSFNQLAQTLGQVEASRRQWVADTSHELRTPLSVLRAQLEAVQDGVRPASAEGTAAMLRHVLSLNKLIDQLYALARADVGAVDEERRRVDVWQVVCEQAGAFAEKIAAAGMTFEVGAAPETCIVEADPERLRQLAANLFENCVRYSGRGARIFIQARYADDNIELVFDDSGAGVPDAALGHLAERFYRVEGSRSREHGGAGLGLALCQRIVASSGGQLEFSRSPLGGLRVLVSLPLAQP